MKKKQELCIMPKNELYEVERYYGELNVKKKEIWKDIKNFEGKYQISNLGRVKSLFFINNICCIKRKAIMKNSMRSGYYTIVLRKNGKRYAKQIHRLIAEAFIPNPNNLPIVNHKDFNRTNNNIDNLEWCTQKENINWSKENMRKPKNNYKLSSTNQKYIRLKNNRYELTISKKYIGAYKLIEEAIKERDKKLNELQELKTKK